jgi:hypothetical protein
VAGGPEAIGAMLNVASSVASVARQLVWTVKQFGDGMGDALKRLGRLGEGTDQVVAIIDNVATAVERLAKISQTSGFGAGATNVAYEISRLARGLIDATNMRGEGLGNEVERLKSLADGIQSVAGIAGSVKSALDSLKAAATFDLSGLDRLGEIFGRLAAWAAEMAQVGGEAAGAVTGMFVPALQTLATATGAASDVADRAFGLAMELLCYEHGWTRRPDGSYARIAIVADGMEYGEEMGGEGMEKAGRVLSAANEAKVRAAMDALASLLASAAPEEDGGEMMGKAADVRITFDLEKMAKNDEKMQVFGWGYLCKDDSGAEVVDVSGDVVDPDSLQKAAYAGFNKLFAGMMHKGKAAARVVTLAWSDPEVRKAMGATDPGKKEGL